MFNKKRNVMETGKGKKSFGKKAVTMATLGAIVGLSAGTAFSVPSYLTYKQVNESLEQLSQQNENTVATQNNTSNQVNISNTDYSTTQTTTQTSVEDIAANCLPCVVSITNKGVTQVQTMFGTYSQDSESCGSGIIIGETDSELIIVTNYHVISGSSELSVVFSYDEQNENPEAVAAKVKGYEEDKDIAVIAVDNNDLSQEVKSQIKQAAIGDSTELSLGEQVVAIGNALGYGQSVTTGIISALNREVTVTNDNGSEITNSLIQTDAAINPGNSGGALFNMKGELVGINSVKIASSQVEGMGYAIPISDVLELIQSLSLKETRSEVSEEQRGYLGISGTDVTSDIAKAYDMPQGIYISLVEENSPADTAGLSKGDIITAFDGQTVKTMSELQAIIATYAAGEETNITVMTQSDAGYVEKTYSITLGKKASTENTNNNSEEQPRTGASQWYGSFNK